MTAPSVPQHWQPGQPPLSAAGQRAMLNLLQAEMRALHALFCATGSNDQGTDRMAITQADADAFDNMPI